METKKLSAAQWQVNKYFPKHAIAYQPGLTLVFKSLPTGVFLSQLLYWHGKGSDPEGWIFKTIEEMRAETGLSRTQQETAIRMCKQRGILETKRAGIPAKRYLRLNVKELENLLPSLKETSKVYYLNPPRKLAENQQTISNNTHETTPDNTKDTEYKSHRNSSGISSLSSIYQSRGFSNRSP